jgi:ATP-dependent helicase/nuclease subunit A
MGRRGRIVNARKPDPDAAQRRAADGRRSVWVSASAGTGKTKVLTDRLLNLLLSGTAPSKILCLTFTKAAAAEMANRLNRRLSEWAVSGDEALGDDILGITGERPDERSRARARRLFAEVLDTPGGMRIVTIHAFCQSLLRRFPLEAGVPPQFEVMDERGAAELLAEARASVLDRARSRPEGALALALATVTAHIHEGGFAELMRALTVERGRLARRIEEAGGVDAYLDRLRARLDLAPGEDEASCRLALADARSFDGPSLRRAASLLSGSGAATDARTGEGLARWLAAGHAERAALLDDYFGVFLTAELKPRKKLATQGVAKREPFLVPALEAEQARLELGRKRLAATIVHAATAALTLLSDAFLETYEAEKRRRALLDYDDLILTARRLLGHDTAGWVLFKLDGGIDHILIDEAQDTNPDQWAVVASLAEEFFAGLGASDARRTIFAVGDPKQSIFSFQRADPREFVRMHAHFAEKVRTLDRRDWDEVPLHISFRSTSAVLDVVDKVFARDEARDGVALDGLEIRHEAFRHGQAGRVEIWPALEPADDQAPEGWETRAADVEPPPRLRLARLIAGTIRHWLDSGERLDSRDRPVRAGDVLVLVRRRGGFVAELVRELKRRQVPVAGTDRMVLTDQLAVIDLMALGGFLLLPEDDLNLAALLKSPLVGLDEDQLFALAHRREGSLWQALRRDPSGWAGEAAALLSGLLARADYVPPFELYASLLGAGRGRERLVGRLGYEASDAIDEFLTQCLAYEQRHVASLQGFLAWLGQGEAEIKRDLDEGTRDQVRIMTVHGAKGLQAPIVFLPDTISSPTLPPPLLWTDDPGEMLWVPSRGAGDPVSAAARADADLRRDQEYRRLLYVGLTRAEDRLYVCGWKTRRSTGGACWYDLVEQGMLDLVGDRLTEIAAPPGLPPFERPGMVWRTAQSAAPRRAAGPAAAAGHGTRGLPGFARTEAPRDPVPAVPLTASRPDSEDPPVRSPLGEDLAIQRFRRGLLIHRLLQTLPDLPASAREIAARRFLARPSHEIDPEMQDLIARETLAVLDHGEFAPLFGPASRAEVPIVGLVPGTPPRALSARVDRLVVTGGEVLVVDYKTNRPPPRDRAQVAPAYVEQLALYRQALSRIYPAHRVRTLLLWTDGPSLMEIEGS